MSLATAVAWVKNEVKNVEGYFKKEESVIDGSFASAVTDLHNYVTKADAVIVEVKTFIENEAKVAAATPAELVAWIKHIVSELDHSSPTNTTPTVTPTPAPAPVATAPTA